MDDEEKARQKQLYLDARFTYSVSHGDFVRAEELLAQGAQINNPIPGCGQIHLFRAVSASRKDTAMFLIKNGADPNVLNAKGDGPLQWAALYGDEEDVRMLLEAGADPTIFDRFGYSALADGILRRKSKMLKLLVARSGANLDIRAHTGDDNTLLTFAMLKDNDKAMRILLAAGANANCPRSQSGLLPLVLARDDIETATILLLYGADPAAALTQMRERGLEESAAAGVVERLQGWPRVSPLKALCLRAVEKHRMTEGVPPLLLMMPDPEHEIERERQRRNRQRGLKRSHHNTNDSLPSSRATKKQK